MKERGGESKKGKQGKKRREGRDGGRGKRGGSHGEIVKNILSKSCPKNEFCFWRAR